MSKVAGIDECLRHLIAGGTMIDVRAPVEFNRGSLPGAICLPILNDEERQLVGTCYKEKGPDAAVTLGHKLVSGEIRTNRIDSWVKFMKSNPRSLIYCFRGGQRSQLTQAWIEESGESILRIDGGYKRIRNVLLQTIENLSQKLNWLSISGQTGAGKTHMLHKVSALQKLNVAALDLEFLAKHKGSAFGGEIEPQPTQIDFENLLAVDLLRLEQVQADRVLVEDEARTIGKVALPQTLFNAIRLCPMIVIEESVEVRAAQILNDYVLDRLKSLCLSHTQNEAVRLLFETLRNNLLRVERKLGTERCREALGLLDTACRRTLFNSQDWSPHLTWIQYLLENYYDSYYLAHIERQSSRICFRGSRAEVLSYLSSKNKP